MKNHNQKGTGELAVAGQRGLRQISLTQVNGFDFVKETLLINTKTISERRDG